MSKLIMRMFATGATTALILTTPLAAAAATAPPDATVAPATPGTLLECESLADFAFEATVITSATLAPEGELTRGGEAVGEHCVITGHMNERVSEVDNQTYAIGFEMRLPVDWSGRFLYQGNGGLDGSVVTALGAVGGAPELSALQHGFAVISSDAGHTAAQNPLFGIDPQARLDYGYQAAATLTPMAKSLIEAAYGRGPDTSYMAGGSNGGRHAMVGASRLPHEYDGFYASAPGFNLPRTNVNQMWIVQNFISIATDPSDLNTAFTAEERRTVADAILEACDALDGLADGLVYDSAACQEVFDLHAAVPTCDSVEARDGTCLTAQQKDVIAEFFTGATTSTGEPLYAPWPYDPAIATDNWSSWILTLSAALGAQAMAFLFTPTPEDPSVLADPQGYALSVDLDEASQAILESGGIYTESATEYMTPPNPTDYSALRDSGGKMLVVHGVGDGAFSSIDTADWFQALDAAHGGAATDFVRYFEVPGMTHTTGGPSTDQFDGLAALVDWVEYGVAPERIEATARGSGNALGVNADVPGDWAPDRTRPLCLYPLVAQYTGGDPESAESFVCAESTWSPEPTPTSPAPTTPEPTSPAPTLPAPTSDSGATGDASSAGHDDDATDGGAAPPPSADGGDASADGLVNTGGDDSGAAIATFAALAALGGAILWLALKRRRGSPSASRSSLRR